MAKDKHPAGLPGLDSSASHLLHRAVQLALDVYGEEVSPGGLTQRQYALLLAVESKEGLTQNELVRLTGIDRSTLAEMAARLLMRGLLERERSPSDARLLRRLPGRERDQFVRLLFELVSSAERPAKAKKAKKAEKAEKKKRKDAEALAA